MGVSSYLTVPPCEASVCPCAVTIKRLARGKVFDEHQGCARCTKFGTKRKVAASLRCPLSTALTLQ